MTKSLVTLFYLTDDKESGVIEDEVVCVCVFVLDTRGRGEKCDQESLSKQREEKG